MVPDAAHAGQNAQRNIKGRKLLLSIVLNLAITVAQFVGGLLSGSLSLLSDALHNLSDVISLLISYFADRFSQKSASVTKTFGYKRAEIFAAFINSATLIIVAVYLIYIEIIRFTQPQIIESDLVIRSEERRVGKECRSRWSQYQ